MRYTAVLLSIATILSLNVILLLGAVVHDPQSIRLLLGGLVALLDLSLLTSSGLLGFLFFRQGHRFLAAVFSLNVGIFLAAVILRISGVAFPPWLLYAADIYWLNLYISCLTRHFKTLLPTGS